MVNREITNKLINYKLLVSKHFDIDELVIYSSYAKGTQNADSDIDVVL